MAKMQADIRDGIVTSALRLPAFAAATASVMTLDTDQPYRYHDACTVRVTHKAVHKLCISDGTAVDGSRNEAGREAVRARRHPPALTPARQAVLPDTARQLTHRAAGLLEGWIP